MRCIWFCIGSGFVSSALWTKCVDIDRSGGKRAPRLEARAIRPWWTFRGASEGVRCSALEGYIGKDPGMLEVIPFPASETARFRELKRLHLLGDLVVELDGKLVGGWGLNVAFAHAWRMMGIDEVSEKEEEETSAGNQPLTACFLAFVSCLTVTERNSTHTGILTCERHSRDADSTPHASFPATSTRYYSYYLYADGTRRVRIPDQINLHFDSFQIRPLHDD